jgi:hypothetical protein
MTTTAFSILDVLALTGDGVTCPVGCPLCHCINATESNVDACTRTRSVEACTSNALDEYTPVCWAGGGRRRGGDVRCPVRRRMRRTAAGHAAGLPVSTLRHIGVLQRLSIREGIGVLPAERLERVHSIFVKLFLVCFMEFVWSNFFRKKVFVQWASAKTTCREKVFGSLASNKESVLFNSLCVGNRLCFFCREIFCTFFVEKSVRNHTNIPSPHIYHPA